MVEGRLKFSSIEHFYETTKNLSQTHGTLAQWESNFRSFTSLQNAYNNIPDEELVKIAENNSTQDYENIVTFVGEGEERALVMTVDDPILARIFNKEGLVQIGEKIYKITYSNLYITSVDNLNKLTLSSNQKQLESENVVVEEITRSYINSTSHESLKILGSQECIQEYRMRGGIGGIRKRLIGRLYTTNAGSLYSSAGASTRHQQFILGVWVRKSTQAIRLKLSGQFTQYFGEYPPYTEFINYDTGEVRDDGREAYQFEFCAGVSCRFTITNGQSYHWGRVDNGDIKECNLSLL